MSLTDAEVMTEIAKMTSFIKQESIEKAREIRVKADEEFALEKGKIVRGESINIDATLARKIKQVEIEKKIVESNQTNASRLKLLELREELLERAFDSARAELASSTTDKKKYATLLHGLILQGLFTMMEKDVKISARAKDVAVAQKAAKDAAAEFEKQAGYAVKVEVDGELAAGCAGGVKLVGYGNRIVVDNTLDERLRLLQEQTLPEIRDTLFGQNENRRFFS